MATQADKGRTGQIKHRIQVKHPVTERWIKIDTNTGRIISHKKTPGPYKGIRQKK